MSRKRTILIVESKMLAPLLPHPALTPQQNRVVALLSVGASNQEISARLFLSPRTVQKYVQRIAHRLGIEWEPGRMVRPIIVRVVAEYHAERRWEQRRAA